MRDVVSCVVSRSKPDRAALGLFGAGQRLARELRGTFRVLILGGSGEALLSEINAVADTVHVVDHPLLAEYHPEITLSALTQACRTLSPHTVLLGNETSSQELTPRLAHRLGGSATGDGLRLRTEGDMVLVTRPVYGGKAQAVVGLKRVPAVIWLRARAHAPAVPTGQQAEVIPLTVTLSEDERVKVVQRQTEVRETVPLEEARVIVSGGRGLGGPEPFTQLGEMAKVLGAHVAASRAACDAGWVPHSMQVGQTGKKVAPALYLAIAISGASQHLMGIADAKVIAAINIDREAPIFKHCRFGLVEDYRKVIGPLREELARLLS
jgi:electron transfer flavoprotein alpha subunit